jgi:hypothetical protein
MFEIHWQTTCVRNLRPLAYMRPEKTAAAQKT